MTDRHAVIWTRISGTPVKMASIVTTARECRITYTKAFVDSGLPGLSLLADPAVVQQGALVWISTENRPLHPRLMAMIPPNQPGNLQRRIYAEMLARRPVPPAPGMETEWEMLMLSGRNGIGHLDVFPDDVVASSWYAEASARTPPPIQNGRSRIWSILRDEARQHAGDHNGMNELVDMVGPTPSAGGMIKKVLFSIRNLDNLDTWDGSFRPFGAYAADPAFVDVIVKIEEPQYEGLLDLESLCLDVHRESRQFEVPRSWRQDIGEKKHNDKLRLLAVERFDRSEGLPIPFESLMTVFASGSRKIQGSQDVMWTEVGKMVAKIGRVCNLDIRKAQETLYRRLAFALMTGNGDMHLDNIALLGGKSSVRIAPVYDPAPMRAWLRHNMRMAVPMDFERGTPLYQQIAESATAFGLSVDQGRDILLGAAEATKDFCERVMALKHVPEARRLALVDIVKQERKLLSDAFPEARLKKSPG